MVFWDVWLRKASDHWRKQLLEIPCCNGIEEFALGVFQQHRVTVHSGLHDKFLVLWRFTRYTLQYYLNGVARSCWNNPLAGRHDRKSDYLLQLISGQELQENLTDANKTFQERVFVCIDEELVLNFEAIERLLEV